MGKNNIIKEKIKNGIIQIDNSNCFGIIDCNLRRNISTKAWDKLKGINFDKFQIIILQVMGFSFWIYGNILLVKKLQNKTPEINKSKKTNLDINR